MSAKFDLENYHDTFEDSNLDFSRFKLDVRTSETFQARHFVGVVVPH
jgi:hypothetical protein